MMDKAPSQTLWNRSFIVIMAITFLTYANISVFFQFYDYLGTCPIHPAWFGTLIGIFAAVSLVVRPLVSPFFRPGNARRFILLGTFMVILALTGYSLTRGLWGLMAVRIFHGLAFVVMGSALTAFMMTHVPPGSSARFFGIISIVILIPNTLVPPFLPYLTRVAGGLPGVLLGFAGITALIFCLLPLMPESDKGSVNSDQDQALTRKDVFENLSDVRIQVLLSAMFCMYCGHALVFFYLDGLSTAAGIAHAGLFLTLSTLGEIGVRLVGGKAMDKGRKELILSIVLVCLALGYLLLGAICHLPPGIRSFLFFATGAWSGLGWGVAMPVFNGLVFDISSPRFRSLNINLGMQMFQAGFFIGPFLGGGLVGLAGFNWVFYMCALLSVVGAILMMTFKRSELNAKKV